MDAICRVPHLESTVYHLSLQLSLHCSPLAITMAATLRSLRPLARNVAPALRGRLALPLVVNQSRGYKQPARDMMTGEVIQLPDIDVSTSCPPRPILILQPYSVY